MIDTTMVDVVIDLAKHFIGVPYIWGGNTPNMGFDCSGLVIECLKSVDKLPPSGDWNASMLFKELKEDWGTVDSPKRGAILFVKNAEGQIIHTEICFNDKLSIGASGGGSKTVSRSEADKVGAYVKMRPIFSRYKKENLLYVYPF